MGPRAWGLLGGSNVNVHSGTNGMGVDERESLRWMVVQIEQENGMRWKDPTPEMLNDPVFNAIWDVIKVWDVNVPEEYLGYCGATGNHVRAILDAIEALEKK